MTTAQKSIWSQRLLDSSLALLLVAALIAITAFEPRVPHANAEAAQAPAPLESPTADVSGESAPVAEAAPAASVAASDPGIAGDELAVQEDAAIAQQMGELLTAKPAIALEGLRVEQKLEQRVTEMPIVEKPLTQVKFFNTEFKAKSVAFVVDRSGSMAGARMQLTKLKLAQAILELHPKQKFYVVFYNERAMPMFGEFNPTSLATASAVMKSQLRRWMQGIHGFGGTEPEEALQIAASLKPDSIVLLSDGEFEPLGFATYLMFLQNRIAVHTIAFESEGGAQVLQEISSRTGGQHSFITAATAAPVNELVLLSDLTEELLAQLADPATQEAARQELAGLAREFGGRNIDHGPQPLANDAEREQAVRSWKRWWIDQILTRAIAVASDDYLQKSLRNPNAVKRWAAARAIRERKLELPAELVASLSDPDADVRNEVQGALVQLSGHDYGPAVDADPAVQSAAVSAWKRWLEQWKLQPEFSKLPPAAVAIEAVNTDPVRRWAALTAIRRRTLNLPDVAISAFNDTEEVVRQEAHVALVQLADGTDLGPPDDATPEQRAASVARWQKWRTSLVHLAELDSATEAILKEQLKQGDAMRRWAAVAIVRKRKLELADQLITLLLDVEEEVRREARLALTGLAHGKDLGPEEPSDQAARERAITQWTAWRREQVEKDAQNQLKLARQLESQGKKEPAQRRYEQVVRDFPASDAAREARRHLTP